MIPPCILQSDFNSELIGTFAEARTENDMNHGIVQTIEIVTRERLETVCKATDAEYIKNQLIPIEHMARDIEKNIITYISPQIKPHENVWFFRFWVKWWRLVESTVFQELYILYSFRHGIEEADHLRELLSDTANEWKAYIIIEYGRNEKNSELFIQRIFLRETK